MIASSTTCNQVSDDSPRDCVIFFACSKELIVGGNELPS